MKPFLLALITFIAVTAGFAQPTKSDLEYMRKIFAMQTAGNFEIVRDRIGEDKDNWRPGTYMLMHLKPKRSGKYKLTYSYRVKDKFYYEGESEFVIRVGARNCKRDLQAENANWALFCLGDTVIVPLYAENTSSPSFRLETDFSSVPGRYPYYPKTHFLEKKPVAANPLESSIIYHGYRKDEQLSRAATGGGTISFHAVFEAKKAGQFNIGLTRPGDTMVREVPVIIVKPGSPVSAILPFEKVTDFTQGKKYSSTSEKSYKTTLQILQPGDVFAEGYSHIIIPRGEASFNYRLPDESTFGPVITALPFRLPAADYHNWVSDFLPK